MLKKRNYSDWSKGELIKEVEALRKQKTYGLVWDRDKTKEEFDYYINWDGVKNKEVFKDTEGKFPVLKEVKTKEIITNKNHDYNLLIEGDNYHALAVLNFTHNKAIDVIYIDPPYNTGNKDFKYNDDYIDNEDPYRHSKWLSFMEKRLKLARNLLKKSGVLFISIDDNEVAQLKLLCDHIFGEKNLVSIICQKSRHSISNDLILSQNHNFILVYASDFNNLFSNRKKFRLEKEFNGFSNPDDDPKGLYKLTPVDGPGGARKGNPHYEFLGVNGYWRYSKETMQDLYNKGEIVKRGKSLARKYYLTYAKENGGQVVTTWWDDVGTTTEGTKNLKNILPDCDFNNPKPVQLIERIVNLATEKNGIVLDFFAGSGTTAQAVLELNRKDNGKRQFILCTNDEEKICSTICYPRIQKIMKGFNDLKGKKIEGLGSNLKYFRTDFVESVPTDKNKIDIVKKSTEMLCIKENAFELVKEGDNFKIFKNSNHYLGIIFDDDVSDFIEEAKTIKGKINVYAFSLDESVPEKEFKSIKDRIKLCPIPEVILHVYRRIFKND